MHGDGDNGRRNPAKAQTEVHSLLKIWDKVSLCCSKKRPLLIPGNFLEMQQQWVTLLGPVCYIYIDNAWVHLNTMLFNSLSVDKG